jgi:hypothetical protein
MSRPLPDFRVTNHGTIWTFTPLTRTAVAHCEEMFPEDCPQIGNSYAVEHRFAPDIVADLHAEGFAIN